MQRKAAFAPAAWPVLCLLLATAPAWAQDDPGGKAPAGEAPAGETPGADQAMGGLGEAGQASGDRPWAEGVSLEDQAAATKLFEEGNALLRDSLFLPAVEKYRAALQIWDHPGIHYNLALALLNLGQPIEVHQSLTKAMKYGVAPLDQDKYERAQSYLKLVEKQLAWVEIVCEEAGAQVSIDGKPLFTAPGSQKIIVRAGEHSVVASKRGYITNNQQLVLGSGERRRVALSLLSVADVTVSKRRWSVWMPWSVAGAGAGVALVGGILHWRSSAGFSQFDEEFNMLCGEGCAEEAVPALTSKLDGAETQQTIAVATYVVGGATMAAGLVLVLLNRPQLIRKDIAEDGSTVSFAPIVSPGTAGVSAGFRF